jgi:hypothetical protein
MSTLKQNTDSVRYIGDVQSFRPIVVDQDTIVRIKKGDNERVVVKNDKGVQEFIPEGKFKSTGPSGKKQKREAEKNWTQLIELWSDLPLPRIPNYLSIFEP